MIRFFIFIMLLLLVSAPVAKATHIIGGDFHYEKVGVDTYNISMTVYKDCQPFVNAVGDTITPIGFDNIFGAPPVTPGIFSNAKLTIFSENGGQWDSIGLYFTDLVITNVELNDPDSCYNFPEEVCVQKGVYSIQVVLPDTTTSGYHLSYQRCCRNPSSINVNVDPFGTGIVIAGFIPSSSTFVENSNPIFNQDPPLAFCLNKEVSYDFSATDLDGDVLVYSLTTPLDGDGASGTAIHPPYNTINYNPGFSATNPIAGAPAFTIDPNTGLLTGRPIQLGAYIVGVEVAEYRNGILISRTIRDLRLYVLDCGEILATFDVGDAICNGLEPVQFTSYSSDVQSFHWDFGDLTTLNDTSSLEFPSYLYPENGFYNVVFTTNAGLECEDTQNKILEFRNTIEAVPGQVSGQCLDSNSFDFAVISTDYPVGTTLSWNFGPNATPMTSTDSLVNNVHFSSSGFHQVTLTAKYKECESVEEITVEVFPEIDVDIPDIFIGCLSEEFTVKVNAAADDYEYEWYIDGSFQSNEPSFNLFIDSMITLDLHLVVTDKFGCTKEYNKAQWLQISDNSIAGFEVSDTIIKLGTLLEITNKAQFYNQILYDFGDGEITTDENPIHEFTDIGQFTIIQQVSNDSNCIDIHKITVDVRFDYYFYYPNVFTPNGDGLNDTFFPVKDGIKSYSLEIFDRWGKRVYDGRAQKDYHEWDGVYESGTKGAEEVFNYFSTYVTELGKIETVSGYVLLIK